MKGSPGYVLITVLAVSALLAGMLLITLNAASTSRTSIVSDTVKTQAFYAAQSGLERAWARASTRYRAILPANAKTSTQAAQWLAPQLASSGTLPGAGSYTLSANVTAGSGAGDATITLTSTGENTTRSAKRRVKVSFPVRAVKNDYDPGPMIATAPAALSVTDTSSINGSAPVSGDIGGIVARHTFNCPASFGAGTTCQKSRLSPPQYTVRYKGAIPTTFTKGAQLRPTSTAYGQRSEERYIVNSVNRTTGEVTLDVLSDYLASTTSGSAQRRTFPGSGDIEFNQITDVPALLLPPNANFSNVSNNVRQVCCSHRTRTSRTSATTCGRSAAPTPANTTRSAPANCSRTRWAAR